MDFFDNKKLEMQRAIAPKGMFDEVKKRLVQEQKQIAQTFRQWTISVTLLLLMSGFNIGFMYYKTHHQAQKDLARVETVLKNTYFNNHLNL